VTLINSIKILWCNFIRYGYLMKHNILLSFILSRLSWFFFKHFTFCLIFRIINNINFNFRFIKQSVSQFDWMDLLFFYISITLSINRKGIYWQYTFISVHGFETSLLFNKWCYFRSTLCFWYILMCTLFFRCMIHKIIFFIHW